MRVAEDVLRIASCHGQDAAVWRAPCQMCPTHVKAATMMWATGT